MQLPEAVRTQAHLPPAGVRALHPCIMHYRILPGAILSSVTMRSYAQLTTDETIPSEAQCPVFAWALLLDDFDAYQVIR